MFEKASRAKLRFNYKGSITVEDLWDLTPMELDTIFKGLNAKAKATQEDSLLDTKSAEDATLALQIEIIKHVVAVKLQEEADRKAVKERIAKRKKLMGIIADKEDAALQNMSIDDLRKELDKLE